MPLRFEYVPGEVAVYVERGDILFHDAYLWHSAARATSDTATRRHVRGGYYGGTRTGVARYDEFAKNAAR
jgi:ectoine hydroxylase-related dioxygenase (phytanoyl-CoA dioxygenase family)